VTLTLNISVCITCVFPSLSASETKITYFHLLGVRQSDSQSLNHFTHLLTYSLTYLLTYSLTHLLTYSLNHLLTYSLTHLLTYSLTHFTHLLAYSLTHLLTYSLTHSEKDMQNTNTSHVLYIQPNTVTVIQSILLNTSIYIHLAYFLPFASAAPSTAPDAPDFDAMMMFELILCSF